MLLLEEANTEEQEVEQSENFSFSFDETDQVIWSVLFYLKQSITLPFLIRSFLAFHLNAVLTEW